MYCSTCECEFEGWTGKCPQCKNPLLDESPSAAKSGEDQLPYADLLKMITDRGGQLDIDLAAVEVSKTKARRFPWLGYGYAWTKRMQGEKDGISVNINTTKVGKDRRWQFPYQGHGYAWRQEMQGSIGGQEVTLTANNVTRKRTWGFPYSGYGYAWTEDMTGECGQDIKIELKTTQVRKIRRWMFPYFGYGYAWVTEGVISMSLVK